jgi:cell division protein ZapA (FtsZ GTPase activity inhibitor)
MPIDNTTNLNISNPSDILGNQDVDRASASTKTVELNPVNNSRGITEVSATDDFITTFSGTPKPSLRQPEIPLGQLIDQTVTLAPEVAKMLNLSTQPTLGEFITSCTGKLTDDIGKIALDDKVREAGGNPGKFDSEMMDCMIALLTMDSKSKLIQTLRETLQAKINDRKATNQKMIDKNVEIANKNAEAIKQQEEVQAKAKLWGILGAVFSAIVAVVSAALTVATFGAATPLAAAVATLAICGCAMTVGGSVCTIVGLAADNETLQKIGMGLGIAGSVFSLASGIGSIWVAAEHAANVLKVINIVTSAVSGVTSSVGQIVNGIAQEDLAETEKELATMKIDLAKLDNQIELLSGMIDKIAKGIQDFMKDLFQDEEEVSQMIRQMMQTSLDIGQNVKC